MGYEEEEDEDAENCPLCCEPVDEAGDPKMFYSCPCAYRTCMFCVQRLRTEFDGKCPNCRNQLDPSLFRFVDRPQSDRTTNRHKQKRKGKTSQSSSGDANSNSSAPLAPSSSHHRPIARNAKDLRDLAGLRIVQQNLVYLIGLAPSIATEEFLRSKAYFGQYGRLIKVAINKNEATNSYSAYLTYDTADSAATAIRAVNGYTVDGHTIRACLGMNKPCSALIRGLPCNNASCTFVHELQDDMRAVTKEELTSREFRELTQVKPDSTAAPAVNNTDSTHQAVNPAVQSSSSSVPLVNATASSSPSATVWGGPAPPVGGQAPWAGVTSGRSSSVSAAPEGGAASEVAPPAPKLSKAPTPPPGLGAPPRSTVSLLQELGGIVLTEYLAANPNVQRALQRAPGPRNAPPQPSPEPVQQVKDFMLAEVEKAAAQLLAQHQHIAQQRAQKMLQMQQQQQQLLQQQQSKPVALKSHDSVSPRNSSSFFPQ